MSSNVISLLYFIILGDVTVSTDSPAGTTQGSKQTTVAAATTEEASVTTTPTSKVTSDKGTTVEDRPTTTTPEVTTEFRETTPEVNVETTRPEPSTEPSTRTHRPTSPSVSTRPLPESTTRDYFSQHTTIGIVTLPTRMMTSDESSPEPPTRPRPRCPPIVAPMHGSYTQYDWYRRGEKVVFSCDHSYVLIGPEWIICFNGEWSGPVPECKSEYSFPDSYIQWFMFAKCIKWELVIFYFYSFKLPNVFTVHQRP